MVLHHLNNGSDSAFSSSRSFAKDSRGRVAVGTLLGNGGVLVEIGLGGHLEMVKVEAAWLK